MEQGTGIELCLADFIGFHGVFFAANSCYIVETAYASLLNGVILSALIPNAKGKK